VQWLKNGQVHYEMESGDAHLFRINFSPGAFDRRARSFINKAERR